MHVHYSSFPDLLLFLSPSPSLQGLGAHLMVCSHVRCPHHRYQYGYCNTVVTVMMYWSVCCSCSFEGTKEELRTHLEQCKFEGLKVIAYMYMYVCMYCTVYAGVSPFESRTFTHISLSPPHTHTHTHMHTHTGFSKPYR